MVRALASHQCGPGSNPGVDMWVEFVVGSLPCSERFFSGYSGFPLSPKTNTSKFQFDLERTDTEKQALKLLGASWVNKLHLHFFFTTNVVHCLYCNEVKQPSRISTPCILLKKPRTLYLKVNVLRKY